MSTSMATIRMTLRVLEFIKHVIAETGESPTYQEIANEFQMRSIASVHSHVIKMEERGWITRTKHCSRAIRIVERRRAA